MKGWPGEERVPTPMPKPKIVCYDNVEYFKGNGYMTPHFHPDGTLYTCN